jgi:circadian clock protein KaiC
METIDRFQPSRVVIDSLSSLERVGSRIAFREFAIGLTSFVKQEGIATLVTVPTSELRGSTAKEDHISSLTDTIILLRYAPEPREVKRVMTVLKMRGSAHNQAVRQYDITSSGMEIGEPYAAVIEL